MRRTSYKEQIRDLLAREHLLSLEAVHERIPEADFSTIFRNVQQLVAEGAIKKVVLDSKVTVYELGTHRHDHFVCDECQQVEIVSLPAADLGAREVRDVLVRGRCAACADT